MILLALSCALAGGFHDVVPPGEYAVAVSTDGLPADLDEAAFLDAVDDTLAAWSIETCRGNYAFERSALPWDGVSSEDIAITFDADLDPDVLSLMRNRVLSINPGQSWITLADQTCADAYAIEAILGHYATSWVGIPHNDVLAVETCDAGDAVPAAAYLEDLGPQPTTLDVRCVTAEDAVRCSASTAVPGTYQWATGEQTSSIDIGAEPGDFVEVEVCFTPDSGCYLPLCASERYQMRADEEEPEPAEPAEGCGCAQAPASVWWLFAPGLVGLRRRR